MQVDPVTVVAYSSDSLDGSVAPPPLASGRLADIRALLERLHEERFGVFYQLFELGEPVNDDELRQDPSSLVDSGICVGSADRLQSKFMIKKIYDSFILTDFPHYRGEDRVLYLASDESVYVAHALPDCSGHSMLDVGTGSGVLSIVACQRGSLLLFASTAGAATISFNNNFGPVAVPKG